MFWKERHKLVVWKKEKTNIKKKEKILIASGGCMKEDHSSREGKRKSISEEGSRGCCFGDERKREVLRAWEGAIWGEIGKKRKRGGGGRLPKERNKKMSGLLTLLDIYIFSHHWIVMLPLWWSNDCDFYFFSSCRTKSRRGSSNEGWKNSQRKDVFFILRESDTFGEGRTTSCTILGTLLGCIRESDAFGEARTTSYTILGMLSACIRRDGDTKQEGDQQPH